MEQYKIISGTETVIVLCLSNGNVLINGENHNYQFLHDESGVSRIKIGNNYFNVFCKEISENDFELWIQHHVFRVKVEDSRTRLLSQFKKFSSSTQEIINIKAPMPGLIKAIEVNQDEIIEKGGGLIILEAMKMENEIRSVVRGKVKSIEVKLNTSVEKDQTLITIEPINTDLNKESK